MNSSNEIDGKTPASAGRSDSFGALLVLGLLLGVIGAIVGVVRLVSVVFFPDGEVITSIDLLRANSGRHVELQKGEALDFETSAVSAVSIDNNWTFPPALSRSRIVVDITSPSGEQTQLRCGASDGSGRFVSRPQRRKPFQLGMSTSCKFVVPVDGSFRIRASAEWDRELQLAKGWLAVVRAP